MNRFTRFSLILLRLAIGWHFLFEGIEKVESVYRGQAENGRPFSSEPFLREASGPVGDFMRKQIGDADEAALTRLTVHDGQMAPEVAKEMDDYFQRFVSHYQLDEKQTKDAEAKLAQSKDQVVPWIGSGGNDVDRPLGGRTVKITLTTAQRIKDYKTKLQQVRDLEKKELTAFNHDVEKQNLRALKAEAVKLRTELLTDLMQPLKDGLRSLLTDAQKKMGAVPDDVDKPISQWSRLQWIDWITRWGLVAVGACLLLGFLTRTTCLGGAAFLLLLYLSMPPFPWLPEVTRVEGHYYYVNKNLIEMLALLVLATTCSGRWFGLDGLVRWLNPWRRSQSTFGTGAGRPG